MIFETGSMSPTIPVGSLGLARTVPASQLNKGDVATVVRSDGTRITHRVVSVEAKSSVAAMLTMQGDANPVPDPEPYIVADAQRMYFTMPVAGYIVSWLGNPFTVALEALGVVALILIAFAPERGWRRSRGARRLLGTTAASVSVAVAATGVVGPGEAHAATASATATGSLTTGRPVSPTTLSCVNTTTTYLLLPYSTVELRWPNPPAQSDYTYELSFPGQNQNQTPINIPAASRGNPAVYKFEQSILQNLIGWIIGGGSYDVVLTNKVGNFRSSSTQTQGIRATKPIIEAPAGIKCVTESAAARSAPSPASTPPASTPSESTPPESTPSTHPSESAGSATQAPDTSEISSTAPSPSSSTDGTAPATPELPSGGIPNSYDAFVFYHEDGTVTIRDAKTADIVYSGNYSAHASVRWVPRTEKLEIVDPDGTVTVVSRRGDEWVSEVTPPRTPEAPAPTAELTGPAAEPTPTVAPTPTGVPAE